MTKYSEIYTSALINRSKKQIERSNEIRNRNSRYKSQLDKFNTRKQIMETLKCEKFAKNIVGRLCKEN